MPRYAPTADQQAIRDYTKYPDSGILTKDQNTGQWNDPQIQALVSGAKKNLNAIRNPVVLYEGDSITARSDSTILGGFPSTGNANPNPPTASKSAGYQNAGYAMWERVQSGGIYSYVDNGVSGNTTQQIRDRVLATSLGGYDAVSLMCGMNDIPTATPATIISTIFPLILEIVNYVGAAGIPLRILTVTPRDATGWDTANKRDSWRQLNSLIRALPQTYPWVFVGDAGRAYQDQTSADPLPIANSVAEVGSFAAGGTHPSTLGAYLISTLSLPSLLAALRWAGFGQIIDGKRMLSLGGTELLTNTNFATQTGGTVPAGALTGTVPSGWRIVCPQAVTSSFPWYIPEATRQRGNWVTGAVYAAGDGATNVGGYVCLVAHTAGTFATDLAAGKWQRVWCIDYCWQVDMTATGADQTLDLRRAAAPSFLAGDTVISGSMVATESWANLKGLTHKLSGTTAEYPAYTLALYDLDNGLMGGNSQSVGGRIEGLVATPKGAICAGLVSSGWVTNIPNWDLIATSVGAGTVTLIVYSPFFRKF